MILKFIYILNCRFIDSSSAVCYNDLPARAQGKEVILTKEMEVLPNGTETRIHGM